MFEALGERLTGVFDRLTGRGVLSPKDIDEALREVRLALLDADVALPVVKDFIDKARELATGEAVLRAVKPSEQVVKIVHDGLVTMLGGDDVQPLNLAVTPPAVILMAGLQGSGKTTTTGKLAVRITKVERKKVLMASLDTRRPAAMEQLAALGKQAEIDTLPIVAGQSAADIARRALNAGRLGGYDVLILDTAGRTTLDEAMMSEAAEIARIANPTETLLVADSLTGQDAVRTAKAFHERQPLTGLVLTRTVAAARPCPCARSPACRSSSWARAKSWMRWNCLTPGASQAAFWALATWWPWLKRPPPRSTAIRPRRWPGRWPRASSTWTTWPTSCARCSAWAGCRALWACCPACNK